MSDIEFAQNAIKIATDIYKKTFGYQLDRVKINDDGSTTHIHSDEFLDNHPERRDNPEFTEEEEKEALGFIAKMAKDDFEKFGPLQLNKNIEE